MLRHVVMLKFKEGYSEETLQSIIDQMNALPEKVPQIVSYTHGKNAGVSGSKFDYAFVADFASEADYQVYRDHPAHQAIGQDTVKIMAEAAQMQFYC